MPRPYTPLFPLWYLHTKLKLSDRYPSGLEWRDTNGWHEEGEMAGKWNATGRYYLVRMNGSQFHAHRIVYYLRTGIDPGSADVLHDKDNKEKDNRKSLTLMQRKEPKYKRTNTCRSDFRPTTTFING
jgi:hypothetical protein